MVAYSLSPHTIRPSARRPTLSAPKATATTQHLIAALTIFAVCYNGVLAMIHSLIHPLGRGAVLAAETLILLCALALIMTRPLKRRDYTAIGLLYFFVADAFYVSLLNDTLYLDQVRNVAIIALFSILGARLETTIFVRTIAIISGLVLFFNILELASTPLYVGLFSPSSYYQATRGIQEFSLDSSGLFRNALGFQGRFSYNIFHSPRTSSLFVEQVALANYAGFLTVYLISLWHRLNPRSRALHIITLLLILVSNNTRTSSVLAAIMLVGYFIFPLLPRYWNILIVPLLIGIGAVVNLMYPNSVGDNTAGRLNLTMRYLYELDFRDMLGFSVAKSYHRLDSGYPYIILSSTFIGLTVLWLFITLSIRQKSVEQKRGGYALSTMFFLNLMIGATAIFSTKIAAPLWLLAGFLNSPIMTANERQSTEGETPDERT